MSFQNNPSPFSIHITGAPQRPTPFAGTFTLPTELSLELQQTPTVPPEQLSRNSFHERQRPNSSLFQRSHRDSSDSTDGSSDSTDGDEEPIHHQLLTVHPFEENDGFPSLGHQGFTHNPQQRAPGSSLHRPQEVHALRYALSPLDSRIPSPTSERLSEHPVLSPFLRKLKKRITPVVFPSYRHICARWLVMSAPSPGTRLHQIFNQSKDVLRNDVNRFLLVEDGESSTLWWWIELLDHKSIYARTYGGLSQNLTFYKMGNTFRERKEVLMLFRGVSGMRCFPPGDTFAKYDYKPTKPTKMDQVGLMLLNGECNDPQDVAQAGYPGVALQFGSQIQHMHSTISIMREYRRKLKIVWKPFTESQLYAFDKKWLRIMLWLNHHIRKPEK